MTNTKVTSVRLDANLLEKASAFGLNVSKVCEAALKNELNKLILHEGVVVPKGIVGVSRNTRILMANEKYRNITRVHVGDKVVSNNPFTDKLEEANVIDVGPLTEEKAFLTYLTIENATGTVIKVLPDTMIFCWKDVFSDADWVPARNISRGFSAVSVSKKRASGASGIISVKEVHTPDVFYRLEIYPYNNFFANSNQIRKLHYVNDYMPSVWTFPVKGYMGQIGSLLEHKKIHSKDVY